VRSSESGFGGLGAVGLRFGVLERRDPLRRGVQVLEELAGEGADLGRLEKVEKSVSSMSSSKTLATGTSQDFEALTRYSIFQSPSPWQDGEREAMASARLARPPASATSSSPTCEPA
jgi:hypothetical protein